MRFSNQNGCTISDEWTYKGMRVIWMENELLRIGLLPDRGSDIFEFRYKPSGLNLLLNLPGRLRDVKSDFSQIRSTESQFEDYYYGGWQEIFPNSKPFNYRSASLGQHGEVSLIPWQYDILDRGSEKVSVRFSCSPLRMPLKVEKTISLLAGSSTLVIEESMTNHGSSAMDLMWGHHIAFGLPFVEDELCITSNATTITSEPLMPTPRRFTPGLATDWPNAISVEGKEIDGSIIPAKGNEVYSELSYLGGFPNDGEYCIQNRKKNLEVRVKWDASVFRNIWMWQERNSIQDFPWWGNCYTLALEPWTSPWTNDPQAAIDNGEWLHLEAGETVNTSLSAGVEQMIKS